MLLLLSTINKFWMKKQSWAINAKIAPAVMQTDKSAAAKSLIVQHNQISLPAIRGTIQ